MSDLEAVFSMAISGNLQSVPLFNDAPMLDRTSRVCFLKLSLLLETEHPRVTMRNPKRASRFVIGPPFLGSRQGAKQKVF